MGTSVNTDTTQSNSGLSLGGAVSDAVAAFLDVVNTQDTIEDGIEELIRQTKIDIAKQQRLHEELAGEARRQTASLQSQLSSLMPGAVSTPVIPSSLQ